MIEVVCGIIRDELGRVLVGLRPEGKHLGGLWEFPGGKVDPGESAEEALARELREELGIDVKVGEALDTVRWRYESAEIRLRPHLCEILGGVIEAMSHERVDWFAFGDLRGLDWAPADVPILSQIESLWG
ncbi:MAG: (deoxy)nucleoside triphosphate pyrophosphohydrolase [Luteolibacter sp.]